MTSEIKSQCLTLAMAATAYRNHASVATKENLASEIRAISNLLPVHSVSRRLGPDEAEAIVRDALRLARASGVSGPALRNIFNDVAEEAPKSHTAALAALTDDLSGNRTH